MELVTGRTGTPHVTSQQDRMLNQGTFGAGTYILNTGQLLEPQVQSSNEIRIRDGAIMVQGALGCIKVNTYDSVTIQNGNQGMQRIDLIVWQYTYDAEQDVESADWVVIQGTPAESDPQQPLYTSGDIQEGDELVQIPVFEVHLDGINVTEVKKLLSVSPDIPTLNAYLSQLSSNLKSYETANNGGWTVVKHPDGWTELHITAMVPRASTETYSLALNFPDGIQLRNAQTFITPARNGWNVANYYHNNDNQDSTTTPIDHTNLVFSAKTSQSLSYYFEVMVCGFES